MKIVLRYCTPRARTRTITTPRSNRSSILLSRNNKYQKSLLEYCCHRTYVSYLTIIAATTSTSTSTTAYIPSSRLNRLFSSSNSNNVRSIHTRIQQRLSTTSNTIMTDDQRQKRVLVPIADGSEEIETSCITDTLTRFGAKVVVASVKPDKELVCTMSRGLKIVADCMIDDCIRADDSDWDMIVLPGGMPGAEYLRDCNTLQSLMVQHTIQQQKPIAAICAAPAIVLASFDSSNNNSNKASTNSFLQQLASSSTTSDPIIVTSYPAPHFRQMLKDSNTADNSSNKIIVSNDNVVVSYNNLLITSQGPATALQFSLTLGELLYGIEKRNEIANGMLMKDDEKIMSISEVRYEYWCALFCLFVGTTYYLRVRYAQRCKVA